jgi:hypothetical protein
LGFWTFVIIFLLCPWMCPNLNHQFWDMFHFVSLVILAFKTFFLKTPKTGRNKRTLSHYQTISFLCLWFSKAVRPMLCV